MARKTSRIIGVPVDIRWLKAMARHPMNVILKGENYTLNIARLSYGTRDDRNMAIVLELLQTRVTVLKENHYMLCHAERLLKNRVLRKAVA